MKILWFTIQPCSFNPKSNNYNGGGWVASLEKIARRDSSLEIAVAFEFSHENKKYVKGQSTFYTINSAKGRLQASAAFEKIKLQRCLDIIDDYRPDIIQIFGSENYLGTICQFTNIPVVIHIQGSIPPYYNALFPQGMNKYDFLFTRGLSLRYRFMGLRSEKAFRRNARKETDTLHKCNYFMGRTDWDHNIVKIYHPEAKYYHVEEALRDSFLQGGNTWQFKADRDRHEIVSVISNPWYKGYDVILKTAKLLKEELCMDFEWKVFGFGNSRFYEQKYGIKSEDVNVRVMGIATAEELTEALCSSSCYVHPSYIENSPNSLCEAQILGVPLVSTNVGGISTLVDDGKTGLLVPANDPFTLAIKIKEIVGNEELSVMLSQNETDKAKKRHDPEAILQSLLSVYNDILSSCKLNSIESQRS